MCFCLSSVHPLPVLLNPHKTHLVPLSEYSVVSCCIKLVKTLVPVHFLITNSSYQIYKNSININKSTTIIITSSSSPARGCKYRLEIYKLVHWLPLNIVQNGASQNFFKHMYLICFLFCFRPFGNSRKCSSSSSLNSQHFSTPASFSSHHDLTLLRAFSSLSSHPHASSPRLIS